MTTEPDSALAQQLKKLQREFDAAERDHELEVEELQDAVYDLEATLSEARDDEGRWDRMMEDLRDVGRGICTVGEVLERWT